ncbi:hypothetical protein Ate01nite_53150 [Actinoplanes teichomyceticus]|nr:hypothetical protein Ate01nite_53150 [Actinoplanes teichomyceticus]
MERHTIGGTTKAPDRHGRPPVVTATAGPSADSSRLPQGAGSDTLRDFPQVMTAARGRLSSPQSYTIPRRGLRAGGVSFGRHMAVPAMCRLRRDAEFITYLTPRHHVA